MSEKVTEFGPRSIEEATALDELADDTAMYLFRALGIDYDDPGNAEIALIVRTQISLILDGCAFIVRVLETVSPERGE